MQATLLIAVKRSKQESKNTISITSLLVAPILNNDKHTRTPLTFVSGLFLYMSYVRL